MQPDQKLSKLESRYQFHSLIGKGGAGEVYAAWDDHLKRTVAIKRIKPNGLDDAALANPWSEAIRLAAIRHANIVTVYDMGQEEDIPFIVMEHVQGETIDERVVAQGVFSLSDFVDMARQTLEGLLAAHHAGLIHRDLKPSNIMLTPLPSVAFRVKILDFGMAKFIAAPCAQTMNIDGTITGSVSWISPEQLNKQVVDARSDLYSLGCVFYYALSGKEPFGAASSMDIIAAHLTHNVIPIEVHRPDLPPLLAQWVMALINMLPADRYQNAMQALAGLNSIMAYTQHLAQPVSSTTTIITPAVQAPLVEASTGLINPQTANIPAAVSPGRVEEQSARLGQEADSEDRNPAIPPSPPLAQAAAAGTQPVRGKEPSGLLNIAIGLVLLLLVGAVSYLFAMLHSQPQVALESKSNKPSAPAIQKPAEASKPEATPAIPAVASPVVAATPAPVAALPPVPVPAPEVVLRVHGSNTVGAKLLPALMMEFLKSEGATDILRKPGKTAEDMSIEAVMSNEKSPKAIAIEAHGSKTAFDGLLSGACDMGMASRPIKEDEAAAIAAAGLGDLHSPSFEHVLGLDGIAMLVNKDNPVSSLTKQEIAGIFSGQITDWQQVGGTPGSIHLYARDSNSGTFDTFKSLALDKLQLAADAKRFEDSNELSDAVAADPSGIGFVGLPFVRDAKALAVSEPGTSPFIASRFTVATEDYLFSRRLFLFTTATSRNNPLMKRFLEFVLSDEGQAVVQKLGFVKQTLDLQRVSPPAGAPAEYVEATKEADRLSLNLRFRSSGTQLDNKALQDLDRIVNMLSQPGLQGKSLLLLGFADSLGSTQANQKLSKDRAQFVAREFELRGFTSTKVLGLGSVLPVASNDSQIGRDKNRRVEVWIK